MSNNNEGHRRETPLWLVLKNAHRLFRRHAQFRHVPLWAFVSELTGHGSTVSSEICAEFGWNPDQLTAKANLPYPKADQQTREAALKQVKGPGCQCLNS